MRSSLRLRFLEPERVRGGQRRVEEQLFELAADDRLAVGAAQEGDGFDLKTFFGDVGQQREDASRVLREIGGERLVPASVVANSAFADQARRTCQWKAVSWWALR